MRSLFAGLLCCLLLTGSGWGLPVQDQAVVAEIVVPDDWQPEPADPTLYFSPDRKAAVSLRSRPEGEADLLTGVLAAAEADGCYNAYVKRNPATPKPRAQKIHGRDGYVVSTEAANDAGQMLKVYDWIVTHKGQVVHLRVHYRADLGARGDSWRDAIFSSLNWK